MLTCAFDRRGCAHDTLFLSEYKRTNRTKGTKILRCFPHCCPEHVNRSYCGTALHVRVQARSRGPYDLTRLSVVAHFEEVGAATLCVGDTLPTRAVFQSLQTEQNPKGEWIQGHAHETEDRATQVFQINPGARWYYEWESAATKAQRFTKHVLKIYVLEHDPSVDRLRIVATTASSEFMVVSYRRAPTDVTGDRRLLALLAENVVRQGTELGLEPDGLLASLGTKMLPFLAESKAKEDKNSIASPTSPVLSSPLSLGRRYVRKLQPVDDHRVWAARHPDALGMSKHLAVLYTFLSAVPAADFHSILSDWLPSDRPASYAETKSETSHGVMSWQFLSPLRATSPDARIPLPSLRDAGLRAPLTGVETLVTQSVQTLSWVLTDETNRQALMQPLDDSARLVLDRTAVRDLYIQTVTTLHRLVDRFLTAQYRSSFRQLHEEIVAVLFRVDAFQSVRSRLLAQLSSTDMAGFEAFVSQARQGFAAATRHSHKRKRDGSPAPMPWPTRSASVLDGSWTLDSRQCAVVPLALAAPLALSVVGAIECMREWATIAIAVDAAQSSLTIRSWRSVLPSAGLRLVLDGKKRVFDAFPSGAASTIPWNGLAWGDYRAQSISADGLMLEFTGWPMARDTCADASPRPAPATVVRVKLCLRPSHARSLSVDAVIEHARCHSDDDVVTLPIAQRRATVGAWTPLYQLKAVYNAL